MQIFGTDNRDTLKAQEDGVEIYALGGNDFLFNSASGTLLAGGAGNDHYRLYNGDTRILEEADGGYDTIWAYDNVVMPDNVEALVFKRVSQWHTIQGNGLDNHIVAGDGDQAIAGGAGNDSLTGGGGRDQFYIATGDGHDVIIDFTPGTDFLTFWEMDLPNYQSLMALATETEQGLLFTFSQEHSLLLEGVSLTEFSREDAMLEQLDPALFEGATLVFEDGFDGADSLNGTLWNSQPTNGHPVTAAIARGIRFQRYVDAEAITPVGTPIGVNPFSIEDGILSITASPTPEHLRDEIAEDWLSGSLETHGIFEQTYGYFEVRARTPEGQGLWPAFWMVPSDHTWPPEADILEALGSQPNVYRAATHGELWGDKVTLAESVMVPNTSDDFHTYGLLWTPQTLTYTFDGRIVFETPTPAGMHQPHSLYLNLAVGGWDGDPDETTPIDASLDVDYVRVWDIPGLADMAPNTDMSAFGDLENGLLYTSEFGSRDLYGDAVLRASATTPDLALDSESAAALVGTQAANRLTGNDLGTTLNGAAGEDHLRALGGADYLIGDSGNDWLEGGTGADTLVGGTGDDTYVLARGDGGASPSDELILEATDEGYDRIVFADLAPGDIRSYIDWARWHVVVEGPEGPEYFSVRVTPAVGGHDLGSYIEAVEFADGTVWDLTGGLYLRADDRDNVNSGSVHNDTLLGEGGDDTLVGMDGDDEIDGGAGIDQIYGWNGNDILRDSGLEGGDRLYGEAGQDHLTGGAGLDFLYGGAGEDTLLASSDGDVLDGGPGRDSLQGGIGLDSLFGGDGADFLFGSGGADLLDGGAGADSLKGGTGADTLLGAEGADTLVGSGGGDQLDGGAGADRVIGGTGDDTLDGGAGADDYFGGAGADLFLFRWGEIADDRIHDFAAEDTIAIDPADSGAQLAVTIAQDYVLFVDLLSGDTQQIYVTDVIREDISIL